MYGRMWHYRQRNANRAFHFCRYATFFLPLFTPTLLHQFFKHTNARTHTHTKDKESRYFTGGKHMERNNCNRKLLILHNADTMLARFTEQRVITTWNIFGSENLIVHRRFVLFPLSNKCILQSFFFTQHTDGLCNWIPTETVSWTVKSLKCMSRWFCMIYKQNFIINDYFWRPTYSDAHGIRR